MRKILLQYVHQSYLLIALALGIIVGTILVLILKWNFFASPLWLVLAFLVFVLAYLWPNYLLVGVIFVLGMVVAFWRSANELKGQDYIQEFVGETVEIEGKISEDPDTNDSKTALKLGNLKINDLATAGTIYVQIGTNHELEKSDIVTFRGKLSSGFGTYAAAIYRPVLKKIAKPSPPDLLLKLRNKFAEAIRKFIPEEESTLGLAYLLGLKNGLSDDLMEVLRVVGLTHIVVASGTHLSILVEAARKLFGKISRAVGLLFSILFIVIFASMIGWTASITRAALVSILSLLAWYVGRKFEPLRLIILTMAVTLIINPMYVINLGWLLSFASYAGIMLLGPKLTQFFYGEDKPSKVAEIIITTIAASLMCTPILLYYYGTMSLISLVANLLILPTMSYAMGLIFATGALAWCYPLGWLAGKLATLMLDYHLTVMRFFGAQTMFLFEIPAENPWVFLLYLLILVPPVISYFRHRRGLCCSCE